MRSVKTIILSGLLSAAALSLTIASCSTDGCFENQSSIPLAGLYSGSDSTLIALDSIAISGVGAPDDSVLYAAGTRLSKVYLPMRASENTTSWKIAYKWRHLDYPELCDTITFGYTSEIYFVSDQCGVIYKYHINSVDYTTHLLEGVEVTDSLITNTDIERIKIYFKVEDDDEEEQPEQPETPEDGDDSHGGDGDESTNNSEQLALGVRKFLRLR